LRKMIKKRRPLHGFVHDLARLRVDVMELNDVFCNVHTYRRNIHLEPPVCLGNLYGLPFGHFDAIGP
jgi:hypothetical protein